MEKINELYNTILSKKDGSDEKSYTASLFKAGLGRISQKVGEEAVETVVVGMAGDIAELKYEFADLLYHSLVLLAYYNIKPEEIIDELDKRKK